MYETVDLWMMGDWWKRVVVWSGDPSLHCKYISIPDNGSSSSSRGNNLPPRFFIFVRFAKGCYTLERISDVPHYMEGENK